MIKITSSMIHANGDGDLQFRCNADDGSVWMYDEKTKEWEQVKPSDQFLTESLNKYLDEKANS